MLTAPTKTARSVSRARKRYPMAPDAKAIARGLRAALIDAGWSKIVGGRTVPDYAGAATVIARKMDPSSPINRNLLLSYCLGRREIGAGTLAGIAGTLGLRLSLVFPDLHDAEGRQITRSTHPDLFKDGGRKAAKPIRSGPRDEAA